MKGIKKNQTKQRFFYLLLPPFIGVAVLNRLVCNTHNARFTEQWLGIEMKGKQQQQQ